jgi:plasmid stabilization system protein ParE
MKLVITLPAKESLKDIHNYYKREVSIKVADKIKSGISQKLRHLADHPYSGQLEETLLELGLEHRRIVERNYKIVYRIIDDVIYVTDIFDSRRDPSKVNP